MLARVVGNMDKKTLRIVEFNKVREILAGYTSFSAGFDLAQKLEPTADYFEAQRRQAETREAIELFELHTSITIGGARDVRRAVDNAERGFTLPAEDLQAIQATISAARTLRRQLLKTGKMRSHTWQKLLS